MSIIQAVAFITLVVFIIYGLWLQFRMRLDIEENEQEDNKKLHEWIKRNPKRAKELGYTNMEKDDMPDDLLFIFHVSLLQFLVVFVLCILRAILTIMHHRYSMILCCRKAGTEIVCLRIVYADIKKALARNS